MLGKIALFGVAYWVVKMKLEVREIAVGKVFDPINQHERNKNPIKAISAGPVSA